MTTGRTLIFSDFKSTWYRKWSKELKQNSNNLQKHSLYANKFWQNAVIAETLLQHGALNRGNKGLGFGVGKERLPAAFANHAVYITATDQDFRTDKAKHWQENELALNLASLNEIGISSKKSFQKYVSFENADMKKIPNKFYGAYDFVWSNCALGHLGSIDAGLEFILNSAKCLKPGGIAVHTTELNVLSNKDTVMGGDTVILRPRDLMRLSVLLEKSGLLFDFPDINFGSSDRDQAISVRPQFGNDFSKLFVGGHLLTQVLLVVRKPHKKPTHKSKIARRLANYRKYKQSIKSQKNFLYTNKFLNKVYLSDKNPLDADSIAPLKKELRVTIPKGQKKTIYLSFTNKSENLLFNIHNRLSKTMPITLSTAKPRDRNSKFYDKSTWLNGQRNRPGYEIVSKEQKKWVSLDYVNPGDEFAFKLILNAEKLAIGNYTEHFMVVQEGNRHLKTSLVKVKIRVT